MSKNEKAARYNSVQPMNSMTIEVHNKIHRKVTSQSVSAVALPVSRPSSAVAMAMSTLVSIDHFWLSFSFFMNSSFHYFLDL